MNQDSSPYRETESLSKIQIAFMILFPALFIAGWALFFRLFPALQILSKLGFPAIALAYYLMHKWLKTNAYERKAKEFKHWIAYTLYIYLALLILLGLIAIFTGNTNLGNIF